MSSLRSHQSNLHYGALVISVIGTVVSAAVTSFAALLMALGSGLASTPEDRVSYASNILWGISGYAFIASFVVLVALAVTSKRIVARILAITVTLAGILCATGWFIESDGAMPNTSGGESIVIAVVVVPVIAGALIFWKSGEFAA